MRFDFLSKLMHHRGSESKGPRAHLAAFGKHPGWDDHIEDLGIDTERLVVVKRDLYLGGIGGNIDVGAWESMDPAHRLDGYGHSFLWLLAPSAIFGRLWSSRDGKGREKYPMVIAAEVAGGDLTCEAGVVTPVLERLEGECRAAGTRDGVIAAVDAARARLRAALAAGGTGIAEGATGPSDAMEGILRSPDLGPGRTGLARVIYQLRRDMAAYRKRSGERTGTRLRAVDLRPQHMRVPACLESTGEALVGWADLMRVELDPAVPLLLLKPWARPWVDVIVGAPTPAQLFCLRAGREAMAYATDVPYTLDASFMDEVSAWPGASSGRVPAPVG